MPRSHSPLKAGALAVAGLAIATPATADVVPLVDVYAGIAYWQPALTGTVSSDGDDFDTEDDLGFERNSTGVLEAGLEHPVPLVPNVRLRHFSLDDSSTSTVTTTQEFGPITFAEDEDVRANYDMSVTDATLYYSPLDNWVSLDIGITARHLDLEVELREDEPNGESERVGGSAVIPMGHLGVRADLPLTGLYATGEVNTISASGDRLTDMRAGLGWMPGAAVGLEAGYKQLDFKLDDVDDLNADVEFGGPYVALNMRF